MKLNILIDARKLGDGGIGTYIENLVDGLLELSSEEGEELALTLLAPRGGRWESRWSGRVEVVADDTPKYSLSEYLLLPRRHAAVLRRHDLFHSPHYTLPYLRGIPAVVTIHDTIHLEQPEHLLHRPVGRLLIGSALRRAAHVICVSNTSARSIRRQFHGYRRPISIVMNALRDGLHPVDSESIAGCLGQLNLPEAGYLLFVGTGRPHKGFAELLSAYRALLSSSAPGRLPRLLAVGSRFERFRAAAAESNGMVRLVGECDASQLNCLYHGAAAVVVPSRAEGFGLVALEAMACGAPLVCSPAPSLREVAGDCAWYSAGFSADDYRTALEAVLGDDLERERRRRLGRERARLFSRREVARRTLDAYRLALESEAGARVLADARGDGSRERARAWTHG